MENQDDLNERYEFLKEYFSNSPPYSPLFHYTSQQGFMGIIENKEIWATQIQYMNDAKELHYAFELANDFLYKKSNSGSHISALGNALDVANRQNWLIKLGRDTLDIDLLKRDLNKSWGAFEVFVSFVFSLSEKKDLLSQWRGYCPKGGGFSIGFELKTIWDGSIRKDYQISKCIYKREQQEELIEKIFDEAIREMKGSDPEDPDDTIFQNAVRKCIINFNDLAPILKHPAFEEEQEWRIISPRYKSTDPNIEYRPGNSLLVPFIKIPLSDKHKSLPISEIYVGPTQHQELSKNSVKGFLAKYDLNNSCHVKLSTIPYREI